RVPGRPDRPLVVLQAWHLDEPPSRPLELASVGVPSERNAHEGTVGTVAPAVVRARELERVPFVVAADLHPAVPAGVEEDVDLPRAVAAEDDRLLPHGGHEVVAGMGDLALVTEEQPRAGEDSLQLLPVDLVAHEDLAADDAMFDVDEAAEPSAGDVTHRRLLHARASRALRSAGPDGTADASPLVDPLAHEARIAL